MKTNFTLLLIFIASLINAQTSGSIDFNGSNHYITVSNSPLNTIGSGDFTVEAWIKGSESQQSNHPTIFSNRSNGSISTGIMFFIHGLWNGSQYKILSLQLDGVNYKFVNNGTYNGSLLDNQCHHVAVSRIGNFL